MNTYALLPTLPAAFKLHQDDNNVLRVVTPFEYSGTGDQVVVRVRPTGSGFMIDENGEAAFNASTHDGELDSDDVKCWAHTVAERSCVQYADETVSLSVADERMIAQGVICVADAAQELFSIATARSLRQ